MLATIFKKQNHNANLQVGLERFGNCGYVYKLISTEIRESAEKHPRQALMCSLASENSVIPGMAKLSPKVRGISAFQGVGIIRCG